MGARNKLNAANLKIAAFIAGVIGLVSGSCYVFLIALAILVISGLASGDIRPDPTDRRRRR